MRGCATLPRQCRPATGSRRGTSTAYRHSQSPRTHPRTPALPPPAPRPPPPAPAPSPLRCVHFRCVLFNGVAYYSTSVSLALADVAGRGGQQTWIRLGGAGWNRVSKRCLSPKRRTHIRFVRPCVCASCVRAPTHTMSTQEVAHRRFEAAESSGRRKERKCLFGLFRAPRSEVGSKRDVFRSHLTPHPHGAGS